MKIECGQKELLSAWQIASRYTANKTAHEALSGIKVAVNEYGKVTLEATNLESSVRYEVPNGAKEYEAGSAILKAGIFGELLKKADNVPVTIEVAETRGTFRHGKSRSRIAVIAPELFPKLPDSSNAEAVCDVIGSELARIVHEGSIASGPRSDFPKYQGTCLLRTTDGRITAVSTDGKRLSYSQTLCEVKKAEDLVLPASALRECAKSLSENEPVRVVTDGATIWFKQPTKGNEYAVRLIDVPYPNYERILNNEVQGRLKVKTNELITVLERVSVIADKMPGRVIALTLQEGADVIIRARASGLGTVREELTPLEYAGAEMSIGFNVGYFMDGLKSAGSEEVEIEFSEAEGQTRIYRANDRDFLYMVMPVKLVAQDLSDDDEAIAPEVNGDVQ